MALVLSRVESDVLGRRGGGGTVRKWIYNPCMAHGVDREPGVAPRMGPLLSPRYRLRASVVQPRGGRPTQHVVPSAQLPMSQLASARVPSLIPRHPGKRTLKSIMMSWSWNLLSRSSCRETGFTSARTKRRNFRPGHLHLLSLKKVLDHPSSRK